MIKIKLNEEKYRKKYINWKEEIKMNEKEMEKIRNRRWFCPMRFSNGNFDNNIMYFCIYLNLFLLHGVTYLIEDIIFVFWMRRLFSRTRITFSSSGNIKVINNNHQFLGIVFCYYLLKKRIFLENKIKSHSKIMYLLGNFNVNWNLHLKVKYFAKIKTLWKVLLFLLFFKCFCVHILVLLICNIVFFKCLFQNTSI